MLVHTDGHALQPAVDAGLRPRPGHGCYDDQRAGEPVVVDPALSPGQDAETWSERVLDDGSRHRVFKRYLTAEHLAGEIGGRVLMSGRWFVAVAAGA